MISERERVDRYLDIEKILNNFYIYFDYCLEKCIKPALESNLNNPVAVCCKDRYYKIYDLENPAFDLLREEREKLYGKPEDISDHSGVSPCEYHTSKGCALKTHKSPICLSFMCRKSIDDMRDRFGIYNYDYLGFNYALEWILTGDLKEEEYRDFRKSCIEMTDKIKKALAVSD